VLNNAQKQAVYATGSCVVMAPPGSGKTRVLQERAAHLLTQDRTGGRIIGVTFTQDAAKELEGRIRRQMGDIGDRLLCGTFHSLCKRQIEEAGFKVKLVNDVQQSEFMQRAYKAVVADGSVSLEDAVRYIETVKSSVTPVVPSAQSLDKSRTLHAVYEAYEEILESMGLMDFGDLMAKAVRGMLDGIEVGDRKIVVPPLRGFHLMVDEVQDTDEMQYQWIRCHVRAGMKLTAVGDDDQSIYGWRGAASYSGILRLVKESKADVTVLDTSYRCAQRIMACAVKLINENKDRQFKQTRSNNPKAGAIEFKELATRAAEILAMADTIRLSGDIGSWVVLARSNALLQQVEQAFSSATPSIKTKRRGGKGFWEGDTQQLYVGLLRSLSTGDMVGVDAVLRLMGVSSSTLEDLHRRCRSKEPRAAYRLMSASGLTGQVETLRSAMRSWMILMKAQNVDQVCLDVASFLCAHGVFSDKKITVKKKGTDGKEEKVKKIKGQIQKDLIKTCGEAMKKRRGPLSARLYGLEDGEDTKGLDDDGNPIDAVTLMTFHGSKGLEFPNVWMMACEEGIVPSLKSVDEEEERRLFYVGMTRAIDRLVMSRALKLKEEKAGEPVKKNAKPIDTQLSRFVEQCGVLEISDRRDSERREDAFSNAQA
jgi:superfamily I DNA/RNA helicase